MVSEKSKAGSARRKGDEYQDVNALRLALEHYTQHKDWQIYIEYENVGNLDDVIVESKDKIEAYQVKYSVDPHGVYTLTDFVDPKDPNKKRVYFKKFSDSWSLLVTKKPAKQITCYLITNHSLDKELADLLSPDGRFVSEFIQGTQYKRPREIRDKLKEVTQIDEENFKLFLSSFVFKIKNFSLADLEQYVKVNILAHKLGISDSSIYYELKAVIEDFAINKRDAITFKALDDFLSTFQRKYLLPQKFEVDQALYIKQQSLYTELANALANIDGDYVVVTGLPGSGKSTSLSVYLDELINNDSYHVVRYYCFVNINDNLQKLRVEAQSLRVNILSVIRDEFHNILEGHFDYSETKFCETLNELGKHFSKQNKKLIIFIDGLDHAERMESEIQDNILKALPATIPKGVVIVVGTQELHKWPLFLKRSRDNPITHIQVPPFTSGLSKEYLVNKKGLSRLSDKQIQEIHQKSEGLPLYLAYIAERVSDVNNVDNELKNIPLIPQGNIKYYYETLWKEFDSTGKGTIRYLCGVLACLKFPVHSDELFHFQKKIDAVNFLDYFQSIKHLLKSQNNLVSIFHNSFREFVLSQIDKNWFCTIYVDIAEHLKSQEGSDKWFSHVFECSYKAKDYRYVLDKVNRDFVDYALCKYRSEQVITTAIYWAVESAKETSDLLAMSRLGSLKSRLHDRLDNFDRRLLLKTLLAMGKENDVISYSYSLHNNQWLIDFNTALDLLLELPNQGKMAVGRKLFPIFWDSFKGEKFENRSTFLKYVNCIGIYGKSTADALSWLSGIELQPDILETKQPFVPNYAPQLEIYINAVVRQKPDECWQKLKKIKKLFPNKLVRYLIIRSIAFCKEKTVLQNEINEYVNLFHPSNNPELAFYAAFAGLQNDLVNDLLGTISLPSLEPQDPLSKSDPSLHNYRKIFFVLGYEGNEKLIEQISNHLRTKKSWWTSYLLYLLQTGKCVGHSWSQRQADWFGVATDAIEILHHIKRGERERIIEQIDLCQDELADSLYWLTKSVAERYPKLLKEWFEKLKSLQDSEIWTTHYGIMESIQNYTFELSIYEALSSIPGCQSYVVELLNLCEVKFKKSTLIKGGSRSDHFIKLASIASQCGFKDKAEEWLQYGIKSTLIYGYHKDTTLFRLIDVLEMLNKYDPDSALGRCADVLEMVDWMHHLTDGKETKYLASRIFEPVAKTNKTAAMRLLQIYSENKARWKMQDSLEILIEHLKEGEPEVLWALTNVFSNHFSDDGRHPKQLVNVKSRVIEMVEKKEGAGAVLDSFKRRLSYFIQTNITPRHWHQLKSAYWNPQFVEQKIAEVQQEQQKTTNSQEKNYKLDGNDLSIEEIKERLISSFNDYKETMKKLKEENKGFYESSIIEPILLTYISDTTQISELILIKDYLIDEGTWSNEKYFRALGHQFLKLNNVENGLDCLERAYSCTSDWNRWERNQDDFKIITQHEKRRAQKLLVNDCYQKLSSYSYAGYDIPPSIASAYDVWGDVDSLKTLYNDYLNHCKTLFEHLPKKDTYQWLKNYEENPDKFNSTAINFLIDQLATSEFDLATKLIDASIVLCLARPEIALPIFVDRLFDINELISYRILMILYSVSFQKPDTLRPYSDRISDLLDSEHFQRKMMVMKMFEFIAAKSEGLTGKSIMKFDSAKRNYSSAISYSSFAILHVAPSEQFATFYQKNVIKTIQEQIESCCQVLALNKNYFLAKMECDFKNSEWTEEKEREAIKDEWEGNVHAQGFPFIFIITSFNWKIFNRFNQILNEIVEKTKVSTDQLEALWRILQPIDPQYKLSIISPKPDDIAPLVVLDKDEWLSELDKNQGKVTREVVTQDWITLFETRVLSHDKTYEVPYRSRLLLHSSLVKKGHSVSFEVLEKESFCVLKPYRFNDTESVTLAQAKQFLSQFTNLSPHYNNFMPILSWKDNSPTFLGYSDVVSLPGYLIDKYKLQYKDFDLYKEDKCLVKYEMWQAGYEDETYVRELLSHGTRLLIHKELLKEIFEEYNVELCQSVFESRYFYESKYKEDATKVDKATHYSIKRLE